MTYHTQGLDERLRTSTPGIDRSALDDKFSALNINSKTFNVVYDIKAEK